MSLMSLLIFLVEALLNGDGHILLYMFFYIRFIYVVKTRKRAVVFLMYSSGCACVFFMVWYCISHERR